MRQHQDLGNMSNFDADACCSMVMIFSFVWSAGANLHDSLKDNYDVFALVKGFLK